MKTVELVVEEKIHKPSLRRHDWETVQLKVAYSEKGLREMLKSVDGKWNPEKKVWLVPNGAIRGTELEKRILKD